MTTIRLARPADAPETATLIMEAMNADCCAWFYGPSHTAEEFHAFMTDLVASTHSQYSHLNTFVADVEGDIAGIIVSYDGSQLHSLRQPFIDGMKERFGRDLSDIVDETQSGELYLDSLCVKPQYRGRGIAKMLINAAVEKTKKLGLPQTGLLVDQGNPKAEKLYRSLGFEEANQTTWGGHAMKHLTLKAFPSTQA